MKVLKPLLMMFFLLLITPVVALGRPDWKTLQTDRFIVFYSMGHEMEAWQVLRALEYYRPQVEKLTGNDKTFRLPVVIDDTGTYMNGFSSPVDYQVHLFSYNPEWWAGVENWWSLVGVHEYTHQLSLANSSGTPALVKNIFGLNPFGMPNLFTPGWIWEGITVYSESQLSPFQGRLNDGLFDAYIGARAKDGRLPSILDATYEPLEFQLDGHYTYGSEFLNYLAQNYGADKFAQFFTVNGGSEWFWLPFPALGIDASAKKVFGKTFPTLWREWLEYEKKHDSEFKPDGTQITNRGWNIASPQVVGNRLYYSRVASVKTGAFQSFDLKDIIVRELDSGKEKAIVSVTSGFSTSLRIKNGSLYYGVNEQRPDYANSVQGSYGYYTVLHQYNLITGKDRVVLEAGLRTYEVMEGGQILYSQDKPNGFGSEVFLFDPTSRSSKLLLRTDYLINEIVTGGQQVIVSARKDWESFDLYSLNLVDGQFTPLVSTPYMEGSISLQGDKLFFAANYNKIYAIYCYDCITGKVSKLTESGYAQSPVYDGATQQLYYLGLNSGGYDVYCKKPEFKEYQLPEAAKPISPVTLQSLSVKEGGYSENLKTLNPKSWWPILYSDNHVNYAGIAFQGCDAIGDFRYNAGLAYDIKNQRIVSQVKLDINYLAPLEVGLSYQDFGFDTDWMTYSPDFEKNFKLDMALPLVSKLSSGLGELKVGYLLNFRGESMEPQYQPYLETSFHYPRTTGSLMLSLPYSRTDGVTHLGSYMEVSLKQYLSGSQLSLSMKGMNDPENPETTFAVIPGYEMPINDNRGLIYSLEYTRPLLKIHKGLWNPSIYFEDLTGAVFIAQGKGFGGERQASWGTELHLETKAYSVYNGLQMDWGLRFTQNMEGHEQLDFFAQILNKF